MILLEPKRIYNGPFDGHHERPIVPWSGHPLGDVPDGHYTIPLGHAAIRRSGDDLTVLAYGTMVHVAEAAPGEPGVAVRPVVAGRRERRERPPACGPLRYRVAVDQVADGEVLVPDDELGALAMAADPDEPIDPDAVPISFSTDAAGWLLPEWYMPAASSPVRGPVRRLVIGGLVLALVVISGAGFCVTYGFAEIAW